MKNKFILKTFIALRNAFILAFTFSFGLVTAYADSLYVTDQEDNTVKRFDANTGKYLGSFVTPEDNGGLVGPRGLVFSNGKLVVVNQNAGEPFAGEILSFNGKSGAFLDAIVPCKEVAPFSRTCDPDAPFLPRGLIRGQGNKLLVANYTSDDSGDFFLPGDVKQFDAETGMYLGSLDTSPFPAASFFPRGLVRGPDGLIYVSITGDQNSGDTLTGKVLRFNPRTGKLVDVFASNEGSGCSQYLHRPEGLVFGPDKRLYVTAFRANGNDTDKVLVFGRNGRCLDQIDLDKIGEPRSYGQALLFGPKGRLFIPITTQGVPDSGMVRRYNVKTKHFDVFIPAKSSGGPIGFPFYLTFRKTDPRTLEYDD